MYQYVSNMYQPAKESLLVFEGQGVKQAVGLAELKYGSTLLNMKTSTHTYVRTEVQTHRRIDLQMYRATDIQTYTHM